MILALALVAVGCDQSEQNVGFTPGDEYRVRIATSAGGDASPDSVSVPDTVAYYVEGYTIEKDYTWTVNGESLPTAQSTPAPDNTFLWEDRGGEFITVVYGPDDQISNAALSGSEMNSIVVDAGSDDIDADTTSTKASVGATMGGQVFRFGVFATLAGFADATGVADVLVDEGVSATLFAPDNAAFDALETAPTNAVDSDEPADSGMLADFLKYHAVGARAEAGDLSSQSYETLLAGEAAGSQASIAVDASGPVTLNGDVTVTQTDIPATNGIVHKIDNVLLPPVSSADFTDKAATPGGADDTVSVEGVYLPEGGFVVLHDSTDLADQGAIPSIVGVSSYLEAGIHTDVSVVVDGGVGSAAALGAMTHQDTDDDEMYDFETSVGLDDGPYLKNGRAVIDYAEIEPPSN